MQSIVALLTLLLQGGRALQEAFNATRASTPAPPAAATAGPDPLPRRVVFAFYGEYHRIQESSSGCADFFLSEQNIRTQMMEPLTRRGVEVGVYFHTVKAWGCADMDQALVQKLRPARYTFKDSGLRAAHDTREQSTRSGIVDSSLKVLELIEDTEWPSETTAVVLLRYNVQYKVPINELDIKWKAVNLAFRESSENWERCQMASDLLHIFPLGNLHDVSAALKESAQKSSKHCSGSTGTGHFVYDPLRKQLGEAMLNFIFPGYHSSSEQVVWPSGAGDRGVAPSPSTFLRIHLSCRQPKHRCSTGPLLEYDCGVGERSSEQKASSPRPRRVVLGFHGHYHRHDMTTAGCSDFFLSEQNIRSNVIDALREDGAEVAVYFHTVRAAGCAEKDQALVEALQPAQYAFDKGTLPLIVDSYMKVMKLIADNEPPSNSTSVVLLRFDVEYQVPILTLNIKWEAMNFAFRDLSEKWERCHMVSDLFLVFPLTMMTDVGNALKKSATKDDDDCFNGKGTGHFAYDPLLSQLGEARLNFISPTCFASSDVPPLREQTVDYRAFLGIRRTCRPTVSLCNTSPHLGPRRVVLGFHGQYHRQDKTPALDHSKCSDFFLSEQNIRSNVIDALREDGAEVAVYFHTVRAAGCAEKDQALVEALQPAQYAFDKGTLPLIVNSYMKVMKLIADNEPPSNSTSVVLLRFDVEYRVPILTLNIKWEAMNFAFRDLSEKWERCHMVSDLFLVFPLTMMTDVGNALKKSATKNDDGCFNGKGTGHFTYDPLLSQLGEARLSFISPGCASSEVPPLLEQTEDSRAFLGIKRTCRPTGDHCSTKRYLEFR